MPTYHVFTILTVIRVGIAQALVEFDDEMIA